MASSMCASTAYRRPDHSRAEPHGSGRKTLPLEALFQEALPHEALVLKRRNVMPTSEHRTVENHVAPWQT
jgi:hypothetical protein